MPGNETEIEKLVVRLTGDGTLFQRMLQQAQDSAKATMGQVASSAEQMGESVVAQGVLIARGIEIIIDKFKEFGREAVEAYEKHEDATVKLNAIIAANGENVALTTEKYEKFAESLSETTTATKAHIEDLLRESEALGATGDAAETAVKWALGLQDSMGHSADSAIRFTTAFAKTGNTEGLTRMLRTLQGIEDPAKRSAEAVRLLNAGVKVSEALANTTSGKFLQLQKAVHALKATIGEMIADAVMPFVDGLKKIYKEFNQLDPVIKKVSISIVAFTGIVTVANGALKLLADSAALKMLKAIGAALLDINPWLLAIAAVVAAVGAAVTYHFGGVSKMFESISESLKPVWVGITQVGVVLKEVAGITWDLAVEAFKALKAVGKEVAAIFGVDIEEALKSVWTWFKTVNSDLLNTLIMMEYGLKRLRETIVETVATIKELVSITQGALATAFGVVTAPIRKTAEYFGVDLVGSIHKVWGAFKDLNVGALKFAVQNEFVFNKLRSLLGGTFKELGETFEEFKARRLKELWGEGIENAAKSAKKLLTPLKEIDKIIHPREAVDFFSVESFQRMTDQLTKVPALAFKARMSVLQSQIQRTAHAVVPFGKFGVGLQGPLGPAAPVFDDDAVEAAKAARGAGGGGGHPGGRAGFLVPGGGGPVPGAIGNPPPALPAGARQGGQNLQGELRKMQDEAFEEIVKAEGDPKLLPPAQANAKFLDMDRRAKDIGKQRFQAKYPAPQDVQRQRDAGRDERNKDILRRWNHNRRERDVDPFAPVPGAVTPPEGTQQPNYEDAIQQHREHVSQGGGVEKTNELLQQILDQHREGNGHPARSSGKTNELLQQMIDAHKNKRTLEVKPLGLHE